MRLTSTPPRIEIRESHIRCNRPELVDSFLELRSLAPEVPWVPVVQGFTLAEYLRCVELFADVGVDLTHQPTVGLGSVCRRQATHETAEIVAALAGLGLRLHGFGVKISGLALYGDYLTSADSLAWSGEARRLPALPGCRHKHCNNCVRYAGIWLAMRVLPKIDPCQFGSKHGRRMAEQYVQLGLPI